jgi:hypothetical protein
MAAERPPATFSLGGQNYTMTVPTNAAVDQIPASDQVIIRDLTKSRRLERVLVISLQPNEAGSAIDRVTMLPGGQSLAYQLADDIGGGSGGPIAELKGRITVDGARLFITCTDQDEWSRDPEWCVPWLGSLKRTPAP